MRLPATTPVTADIMLYLEDYLEMIEQLHHDLRQQFQVMHDLDDRVHSDTSEVRGQISEFCERAKAMTKDQWKEEQKPILDRFKKIIEVSDEKVELSTTLHASVSRYLQRLEKELSKYKSELEADNEGITEVLEQMAMKEPELPESPKGMKKKTATMYDAAAFDNYSDYDAETPVGAGLETLDDYSMLLAHEMNNNDTNSPQSVISDLSSDLLGYVRKRKREQEQQQQLGSMPPTPTTADPTLKKKRPNIFGPGIGPPPPPPNSQLRLNKKLEYQSSQEVFEVDWQYVDPNEPLYCICNQVSYGDMVGCDNPSCPIEWFHYPCVDLHDAPKGKWYCPQCREDKRKK